MKISRSFYASVSEAAASNRVVDFLTQVGYRHLPDSGGYAHFKRGYIMGMLTNFNPTSWPSTFKVGVTSEGNLSKIELETAITSDPFERRFAKELLVGEINLLEAAVANDEFTTIDIGSLKKRIASCVYLSVGLFAGCIMSAAFGASTGMFVLNTFNISTLGAAAIGAGLFLILGLTCLTVWVRLKKTFR